MEHIILLRKAH